MADSWDRTSKRAVRSRNSSDWRTASSSSITCTRLLAGIAQILLGHGTQCKAKDRPALRVRLDRDLAAMRLDDGARDRQPDPHSLRLAGDEGLKQLRGYFRRNAGAGIRHAHRDHAAGTGRRRDGELAAIRILHRLDGIAHEIEHDLLDLHLVGEHQVERGIELESDSHAALLGADQGECARLLDQLLDAFDAALALAAGD